MRRQFVDDANSPNPSGSPGKITEKELRARYLVEEARDEAEVEKVVQDVVKHHRRELQRMSDIEAMREIVYQQFPHCAWLGGFDKNDKPFYVVLIPATPQLVRLMDAEVFLATGAMWASESLERKQAVLTDAGMDPALAHETEIMRVLTPEALDTLLGWQKQINTGGAFAVSLTIGETAEGLIARGYLMLPPHAITVPVNHQAEVPEGHYHGRDEVTQGTPGSAGYVRAMMGPAYHAWLLSNEKTEDAVV